MQLFSNPQQTHAAKIKREPYENCKLPMSSKERSAHASVTNRMPSHSRGLIFSLKAASATRAVAAISKLFKREAFAAVVARSPNSKQMGAAMSSKIIAAT